MFRRAIAPCGLSDTSSRPQVGVLGVFGVWLLPSSSCWHEFSDAQGNRPVGVAHAETSLDYLMLVAGVFR